MWTRPNGITDFRIQFRIPSLLHTICWLTELKKKSKIHDQSSNLSQSWSLNSQNAFLDTLKKITSISHVGRWGSGVSFRVLSYFVMLCRLNQFLFFQVMPTMHLQIDFLILKCSYMHAWGSRNIANHSINQYFYWNLTNSSLQFSVSPFCPKSLIVLHLLLDEHEPPELLACICRSSLKGFQGVIYQKWRKGSKLLFCAYYIARA